LAEINCEKRKSRSLGLIKEDGGFYVQISIFTNMLTQTKENYLKALLHLTSDGNEPEVTGTNQLAKYLNVRPATANDMLKKLKEKLLVEQEKYGKITLTEEGKSRALLIIRKHRIWETFLHDILHFEDDEVHEIAEQLEHIKSDKLIDRLDAFLNFPKVDPHGAEIPGS
jgi:DtxR family Mn-dependent transcriptional regulator